MNELIERLGWVLVHSLWQFALVALLAGVISRAMRRNSSAARYGVHVVAMGVMVVAPLVTWWVLRDDLASRAALAPGHEAVTTISPGADALRLTETTVASVDEREVGSTIFRNSPKDDSPASQTDVGEFRKIVDPTPERESSLSLRAKTALQPWLTWIVVVWCIGVAVCSLRPLLGWHTLWRLKRVGVSPASEEVLAVLRRVSERLQLRRAVSVLQSTLAQVPVVVGYLRPVVLLPVSLMTSLPAEQLEAILAHELAHVRRHDFVVNLLQTLVETFFFYHPAVWWLSHQIRVEREHCCDDLVVASFGNRIEYGRALLAIEELRGRSTVLALGVADGSLLSRIRRIVGLGSEPIANESWSGASVSLVLALCALSLTLCFAMRPGSAKPVDQSNPFVVRLPDGLEVELLGAAKYLDLFPKGSDNSSVIPNPWWRPNGERLEQRPITAISFPNPLHENDKEHCKDWASVAVRIRGLSWESFDHAWVVIEGVHQGTSTSTGHNPDKLVARETIANAGPLPGIKSGVVRVAVGAGELGPWQRIRPDGSKDADGPIPGELRASYEYTADVKFREINGQTRIVTGPIDVSKMRASTEMELVDVDGHEVKGPAFAFVDGDWGWTYPIPLARVAHYRFRLRAYRHWVTFENVSFQPGHKTDVKASVGKTPELRRDPLMATLPNGVRVEFVGLAAMEAEPKTWWKPDGAPLNEAPKYDKAALKPAVATERRGIVRIHGAKSSQDVIANSAGVRMDFARAEDQGIVFCDVRAFPIGKSKTARVEVGLTTESMSPVRVLDAGGTKVPRPADAPADHIAEDIEVEIVVRAKSNNPQTADDARERTWITFEAPIPGHRQMDLDLKLIDKDGKAHDKESVTGTGSDAARRKSTYIFDVPFHRVARFEYRMRLYRHWVTFDNVALNPGEMTDVKVQVESAPEPRAGRGSPDPALGPTEGLQNSDDGSKASGKTDGDLRSNPAAGSGDPRRAHVEPSKLKVLNSDGSQAQFNGIVSASVGFPGEKSRSWHESPTKEGLVSLEKLPPGTHWLVAAGDSEQRTAFQITVPTKQQIVEQRLRNVRTIVGNALSLHTTVAGASPDNEVISIEIKNESKEPFTFSEEDISLTMMLGPRVLSPRLRNATNQPLPQWKVMPATSHTLTIKWADWVRNGLWASRDGEAIDEPWSAGLEPGKVQVRVNLGNGGAAPLFVTPPQTIIKQPAPAAGAERSAVENRILEELDRSTSLTVEALNLSEVVALVAKKHRLPIVVDEVALSKLNVRQDLRTTRMLKGVKLGNVLKIILKDFGGQFLALVVEDDVLKITADNSPEAAEAIKQANQRIEAALREKTEIAFSETPLSDVISYLSDYHNISIQLHPSAEGAAETPITGRLAGVEHADALALILHEAKLSSCIDHGVLLITTPEEIRKRGGPIPRSIAADFAKLEKADPSVRWSALLRGVVEESDSAAIPKMTELLGSDDVVVQRWTARALVPFGSKARAAQAELEKLTRSKDERNAYPAWQVLIAIGREDFSTLPILLSALDREDETLTNRWPNLFWGFDAGVWRELVAKYPTLSVAARRTVAATIMRDLSDSLPFLVLALSDPDTETRRGALRQPRIDPTDFLVSPQQQKEFETALVPRLKDADAECRMLAAGQLLRLNRSVDPAVATILAEMSHELGRDVLRRCVRSTHHLFLLGQHFFEQPCRSESETTRNAARHTLGIICREYQLTRPDHFIMWGSAHAGLLTRLTPVTQKPQVGEPIYLKLELGNRKSEQVTKLAFSQPARSSLVVIGPDGREMSQINRDRQPYDTIVSAEPLKDVVLIEELDLAAEYPIKQPGTYLVQWTSNGQPTKSVDGQPLLPNSNVLTIDVVEPAKVGGSKPNPSKTAEISDALKCRLVAVPATVNDESPDLSKSVAAFARGEDVTLAVELQNVSDRPRTLIGVRYEAKGQPQFEGKLAPEIFAPYLFELEFTDAKGQPVPRTSRVFLETSHRLSSALTHSIDPGKSLVVVLRPSRFHPPMDHRLPPGKYQARVRYHGPSDQDLTYFRSHPAHELRAKAWYGEVTSNPVTFTVADEGVEAKRPKLVWGPVKDGLQAAVEFRPYPGAAPTNDPPGTFPTKPEVSTIFHVKNVSDRTIKFVSETWRQGDDPTVIDESGKSKRLETGYATGAPIMVRWTLKPGEIAELHATSGIYLLKKPGKYTVRYEINFGSLRGNNGVDKFPKDDDWQQVLPTGDMPITIRARPEVVVPINANGEIRGILLDTETGEPVQGARVACGALINPSGQRLGSSAVTDDEGRYRLHVPKPGFYNVWLHEYSGNQWMTAVADDGLLVEAGKVTASQLFLVGAGKITGTLVWNGKPVANPVVKCNSAARPESLLVEYHHKMRTNADGSFSFAVPHGRAYLYVDEESRQTKDSETGGFRSAHAYVDVPAIGDAAPVTLTLQPSDKKLSETEWLKRSTPGTQIVRRAGTQNVTGTVVDESGKPIAGAKLLRDDGSIISSNNKGEFRVETPKGIQLTLHTVAPGYHVWFGTPTAGDVLKIVLEQKQQPRIATASAEVAPIPTNNVRSLAPIEGQVIDSVTGKPIEGATVRFRFGTLREGLSNKERLAELVFRNVGRFTFELPEVAKGRIDLFVERIAEHPDYQTSGPGAVPLHLLFNKEPNHAHDFVSKVALVPGQIVSGQVLDIDGRPAKGITIFSGRSQQGWQSDTAHTTTTDANGRYRLVVRDRERGRIYVIANHAAAVSRAITPEFGEQPVFRLQRGTRLFGRVTDAKGRGVANVVVRADGSDRVPQRFAMTDADGKYSLPPCQYGQYVVQLIDEGRIPELPKEGVRLPDVYLHQLVDLPKTALTEQQLDFKPTESVRMTARYTTSDDQPVSGRSLSLNGVAGKVNWWGRLREVPDQPGLQELRVPRGFEGRIDQNADLGGFLRILRAEPDAKPTSPWSSVKFDNDGVSFHIRSMKASSITLRATHDGQPVKISGSVSTPRFADQKAADEAGARLPSAQFRTEVLGQLWFDAHPDIDLLLKLDVPGFKPWQTTLQVAEGENRVIDVALVSDKAPDPQARAGRGSPDPARDPTAGLPNSDDATNPTNNAKGDLRSNPAAGSGDPRRAPAKAESPAAEDRQARSEELFARKVSLDVKEMPLREALAKLAQAARVPLKLDEPALKKAELDLDEPVTVAFQELPLSLALGRLIEWNFYPGVFRELRGGALSLSTIEAKQERTAQALPDWLKPVVYNHVLLAHLDEDNQVVSISGGDRVTDELLAQLHKLPKLRELVIGHTKTITAAGLAHLAKLTTLEKLHLSSINTTGERLGDEALKHIVGLKSLRELHLNECGTTDAGIKLLEELPQLTHLDVYQEGRLTDAAIGSIAKLKRLKHLGLNAYVGVEGLGWMRFSKEAIHSLAGLQELEHLHLVGQGISSETLQFPRLKSLSLGLEADDACAARVAQCRQLQSLHLVFTSITDDGLKSIATLPELTRLNIDSHVITDAGIEQLKTLKKLDHLSLRASRLTDASLEHIAQIKSLTRLDLNGSGHPGFVVLGNLPQARFTIPGLLKLKALPDLRTLYLTNFSTGGGYAALKELKQLTELSFLMVDLNGTDFSALEEALPNARISAGTGGGGKSREPKRPKRAAR